MDGKCRRVWQKYLGKPEAIAKAVEGGGPPPQHAELFQWGLPNALWAEVRRAKVVEETDRLCPKRQQGLTTGQYLAIAAINRAAYPQSKRSIWEWFSQTTLLRHLPDASKAALTSQRFWDHMDRIDGQTALSIWRSIVQSVVVREGVDLSRVSYDGTNFYTFIDTFNMRCEMGKRGKNKQGRCNLRQINYALFCSADGHLPLFYDVYEGNRHDAKQFPLMLKRFQSFLNELSGQDTPPPDTTLIFDKGNNSADNFALIDGLETNFVGSVKLGEHKDLAEISNHDPRFVSAPAGPLQGTKALRITKMVYGKERTVVVTYNQNLFDSQWRTLHNDIDNAIEKLSALKQRPEDRANGIIKGGKAATKDSVQRQCNNILRRQHMKEVIKTTVTTVADNAVRLTYEIDTKALNRISETYLGKNIIITSRASWDDCAIITAYRSQFMIEEMFKQMKDRRSGSWWPMHHWTDSKIRIHALYCTIAHLLRAAALRRVSQAGMALSMRRFLTELDAIREVLNIYPKKRRQKVARTQSVLTKRTEIQQRLIDTLALNVNEPAF